MRGLIHGDAYEILPTLPENSFDTVIIDPPYGMGIDTWDKPVDVAFFTEQIKRIGKEFYAVFGQMPHIAEWHTEAVKAGLHFCEHITWVKRTVTPSYRLSRGHEEVYIYAVGNRKEFYKTKGRYEDVKTPGILFSTTSIEGIKRHINDLHQRLSGNGKGEIKANRRCSPQFARFGKKSFRSPEYTNFTNVWSFLPESKKTYNKGGKFHPTMKPVLLEMRLVELLTPEKGSVLDCFSGSGTTAIACKRLDRQFLCIEKEQEYHDKAVARLAADAPQPELALEEAAV